MFLFLFFTFGTAFTTSLAGYAGSSSNDVNNGYGYGFSGSFANSESGGAPFSFGFLDQYFDSLRKYHEQFMRNQHAYSFAYSSNAQAQSSLTFTKGIQQQTQQLATQSIPNPSDFPQGFPTGDLGKGGAVASASLGPQGGYQTAAVYPENPNSPNVVSRFAESSGGGPGTYSVFSSSVSSSSNVDGKPKNFHRASTTINDNGKVSTYSVSNP